LAVTILYPAYVILNENSRKARYGWGVEAGTELSYEVFEADTALVDRLVPFDVREPGNAVSNTGTYTLAPSYTAVAQMAEIGDGVLTALQGVATNSGLLVNATRKGEQLYQWRPDHWSYTNAQASGKGEGFCGMGHDRNTSVRFRIRYQVSHLAAGSARYPVTAEISYEGLTPPPGKARAFFIPFGRDQQAEYLVVAFTAKAAPTGTAAEPPVGDSPNAAWKQLAATTVRRGDIGVHLDALGTVESSNSVVFAIPESYCQEVIKKFDAHQELTLEAYTSQGERFGHGSLAVVDNRIDTTTGTLKCKASLIPEGENLMVPGLFLNIRMLLEVKHGVTLVPADAILHDAQGAFVWAIKPDQTVSRRAVQAGTIDAQDAEAITRRMAAIRDSDGAKTDGAKAEIRTGLSPGDVVVYGGSDDLHDGQKVRYELKQQVESVLSSSQPGK
jgi:hypothetical protein